jgi:glycosyltransferase involved in cell wall biosynthesis
MTPLLTVVIPTFQRGNLVGRAVASALSAAPDGDVEVVVVPNGSDDAWRAQAEALATERRVHWFPTRRQGASLARNIGISKARGAYIRFLDDDDVLLPAAADQLAMLHHSGADISTSPLENMWRDGTSRVGRPLYPTSDFVSAALMSIATPGMAQGSIFKTSAIRGCPWPEGARLYDDYLWILDVAYQREWSWESQGAPSAAYVHHPGLRLSRVRRSRSNSQQVVDAILRLHERLARTSRGSSDRTHAAAAALLTHAHSAFPACPFFLTEAIHHARRLSPQAAPLHRLFVARPLLSRHLAAFEWSALLPRYLSRMARTVLWKAGRELP